VRSAGVAYTSSSDCWALSGLATLGVRVLP
jgi:hypothetical protein